MNTTSPHRTGAARPRPDLYISVFVAWVLSLLWFHPRLASLLTLGDTTFSYGAILFFIVFTEIAWLYGFFNVGVIIYAWIYRRWHSAEYMKDPGPLPEDAPAVAILYTTANDFVEESALSCVQQEYPNFTVYILDDSSDPEFRARVDRFAAGHPERVRVVRRPDRKGFKAGNLNHGLSTVASREELFALADADEILPTDFLSRLVPRLLADDRCGFVQANHRCNPASGGWLARTMGEGIDIHWRWYHPLRNRFGFVMLLGHGALIRRVCWEEIGGFPELVTEDLAFSLRARERGWRGFFAEDVICYEDFPETVRAFRVRHMKWTRGNCEFLTKEMARAIRSREVPWVEKLDIFFPTLNLPFSLFYFLFVIDANLVLASLFGHPIPVSLSFGGSELTLPAWRLDSAFNILNSVDFYMLTLMTLFAPILCFVIDMRRRPADLFRFLCRSTALYGALGPLSFLGVLCFAITGKAVFHVTADRTVGTMPQMQLASIVPIDRMREGLRRLLAGSHPDHWAVRGFEIICGIVFGLMCLKLVQISFFGMALAFMLLPLLHKLGWENRLMRKLVYIPFVLVIAGLMLSGMAVAGMPTILFGFGFHF
jgi:cellulose synthase/poly-beta-1,6-N-acetylglucosamine synthase-like glycosyltransferase